MTIDCKSEDGITIQLIDTVMMCASLLSQRNLTSDSVIEALKDLSNDGDVSKLIERADYADEPSRT